MVDSMLKAYVCQQKIVPTDKGPSIVEASMYGCHSDQGEISVCRLQMLSSGASIRICSRVMTGAFSSMSVLVSYPPSGDMCLLLRVLQAR
jgi:hypothetical protein